MDEIAVGLAKTLKRCSSSISSNSLSLFLRVGVWFSIPHFLSFSSHSLFRLVNHHNTYFVSTIKWRRCDWWVNDLSLFSELTNPKGDYRRLRGGIRNNCRSMKPSDLVCTFLCRDDDWAQTLRYTSYFTWIHRRFIALWEACQIHLCTLGYLGKGALSL